MIIILYSTLWILYKKNTFVILDKMKAAKAAAAKVNAMLVASGQLKLSDIERAKCSKPGNLFVEEVVINDAPMGARNFLTMCSTQEEISKMSGASVSTKGRYMTDEEMKTNTNERPLHLQIQGVNEQDVKVAVGRIMHLIMKYSSRKNHRQKYKGNKNFGGNPGDKHKAQPLNNEESTFPVVQNLIFREKVFIPPTSGLNPIDMRNLLIGENGTNFKYIGDETAVSVTLRGIGSGCLEPLSGQEAQEPLNFYLEHSNQDQFNEAKNLVVNLTQTILSQMQEGLQTHLNPQPHLNLIQPNLVNQAQLPCKPNGTPLPMPATYEAQQVYGTPSQVIVPAAAVQQQVITSLAAPTMATQAVAPINSYQPQTFQPYVITSQPIVSNHVVTHTPQDIANAAVCPVPNVPTTNNNSSIVAAAPISIPISVQDGSTQLIPQLVQVSHGHQIIGTPDGPRLITVVCNANGATIVSEPAPVTTLATLQAAAPIVHQQQQSLPGHVIQQGTLDPSVYPHVTVPVVTATMQSTSQLDSLTLPQASLTYHSSPMITARVECPDGSVVQNQHVPLVSTESGAQSQYSHGNGSGARVDYESQLLAQPQPGQLPWSRYSNVPQNSLKAGGSDPVNGFLSTDEGNRMEVANLNRLRGDGAAVGLLGDRGCPPYGGAAEGSLAAQHFHQHNVGSDRPYAVEPESSRRRCDYNVARGMMDDIDESSGGHCSSNYYPSGYPSSMETNSRAIDSLSHMGLKHSIPSVYTRRIETIDVEHSTYTGPIEYNHSMRPKYVPQSVSRDNNGIQSVSSYQYSSHVHFSNQRNY